MNQPAPLTVFVCTDHDGFWPVGVASVVIAADAHDAYTMLANALKARGLDPNKPFTLQALEMVPGAHILRDGNY